MEVIFIWYARPCNLADKMLHNKFVGNIW